MTEVVLFCLFFVCVCLCVLFRCHFSLMLAFEMLSNYTNKELLFSIIANEDSVISHLIICHYHNKYSYFRISQVNIRNCHSLSVTCKKKKQKKNIRSSTENGGASSTKISGNNHFN